MIPLKQFRWLAVMLLVGSFLRGDDQLTSLLNDQLEIRKKVASRLAEISFEYYGQYIQDGVSNDEALKKSKEKAASIYALHQKDIFGESNVINNQVSRESNLTEQERILAQQNRHDREMQKMEHMHIEIEAMLAYAEEEAKRNHQITFGQIKEQQAQRRVIASSKDSIDREINRANADIKDLNRKIDLQNESLERGMVKPEFANRNIVNIQRAIDQKQEVLNELIQKKASIER